MENKNVEIEEVNDENGVKENVNESELVSENMQNQQHCKKHNKLLIIVIAVVLVVAAVIGVISGVSISKANAITDLLLKSDVETEQMEFQYDQLPGVCKMVAKPVLKKNLINTVKEHPYVYSGDTLVDVDAIKMYKKCKILSDKLELSEDSSTNVDLYISEIMKIAEYEADGNCMNMLAATVNEVVTIVETWNSFLSMVNRYSGTSAVFGNAYWSAALTDLKTMKEKSENVVTIARQFNYTDEKSLEFISDLEYIRDNIAMAITDTSIQWNIREKFEDIKTMANNTLVVQNDIKLIVANLPEVY